MLKKFIHLFVLWEQRQRVKEAFLTQGGFKAYTQELAKKLAVPVVYDANQKLWTDHLSKQKIGATLIEIGAMVRKYQKHFATECKELYDCYIKLQQIHKGDWESTANHVQDLYAQYEKALKKEVDGIIKAAMS